MRRLSVCAILCVAGAVWLSAAQNAGSGEWRFLAAGDARNCGDVVMPAIADTARKQGVSFYWHLGDLRAIGNFDEDIQHQKAHLTTPMTISGYLNGAWPDFIESQIKPFGSIPFMLGIGNHELGIPKTRDDFLVQFADWLNTPLLRDQRLKDDPADHRMKTYYHWIQRGVDFILLDNASNDQVNAVQIGRAHV